MIGARHGRALIYLKCPIVHPDQPVLADIGDKRR
jgi:hypothetical protein